MSDESENTNKKSLGEMFFERITAIREYTAEDADLIYELLARSKKKMTTQRDKLIEFLLAHGAAEDQRGYGHITAEDLADLLIENNWITEYDWRPPYDPEFGDKRLCQCGHIYYRHFDSYEDMFPLGCKYCGCIEFVQYKPANIPHARPCPYCKLYELNDADHYMDECVEFAGAHWVQGLVIPD